MRSIIVCSSVSVFCSLLFLQCGGPNSHVAMGTSSKDTTGAVDTIATQPPSALPVKLNYEQQQGKILYTKYCSICHGDQGKGDGFNAYNLDPKPRDFTDPRAMAGIDDATMLATIREGGKGVNKSPLMPAWGGRMDRLQMQYVIAYVKALEKQH